VQRSAGRPASSESPHASLLLAHAKVPGLGAVRIAASARGICAIALPDWHDPELLLGHWPGHRLVAGGSAILTRTVDQLGAYAAGRLKRFTVPLDLGALPPFTLRVLTTLYDLGYATLTSYGELARTAGSPRAARAVGQAVGRNPLPVIIPCHRVIAADGSIGGFGLGLPAKRTLLTIEGVPLPRG
jgi:methylated-DNA-[protein]-cysteine S-methyltransferase